MKRAAIILLTLTACANTYYTTSAPVDSVTVSTQQVAR